MASDPTNRETLVLIFGGRSPEHQISCLSARHLLAAIDSDRFNVFPVGIDKTGTWSISESASIAYKTGDFPETLDPAGPLWEPLDGLAELSSKGPVVVFPLLHGPMGEDGTIQGLLEMANVPYVGSGVLGSALAMDKIATKEMLAHHDLPLVRYKGIHRSEIVKPNRKAKTEALESLLSDLGPAVFVKPANMGSSIGVTRAADPKTLEDSLELAASYDEWIVVEEAVIGREIEVAVLGNRVPQVTGPGEILPGDTFYDYLDKYEQDSAQLILDPQIETEILVQFQDLAAKAFVALRCSGMARVDFFLEEERGPLLNEVNTIPGFTPISMYPKLWKNVGLSYTSLIDCLVELATERYEERQANSP